MKFGAHISTASPFSEAINRAKLAHCECMQVFLNPPQRWNPISIPETEIEKFLDSNKEEIIKPIISHSIYLINLASSNPFFFSASVKSLIDEMNKGKKLRFLGVNTHLGSTKEKTFREMLPQVAVGIKEVLDGSSEGPYFIIENSAGAGNIVGDTLEEIGQIVAAVDSPRVKVLLDTAHLFESGYDIRSKKGLVEMLDEFDGQIGLDRLVGLHLNDSITQLGSKKDRHADIGQGEIGLEAFENIVNHPRLKELFGIIETPGVKKSSGVDNLAVLRSLVH